MSLSCPDRCFPGLSHDGFIPITHVHPSPSKQDKAGRPDQSILANTRIGTIKHLLSKFSEATGFSADVPADLQVMSEQAMTWSVVINNVWKESGCCLNADFHANRAAKSGFVLLSLLFCFCLSTLVWQLILHPQAKTPLMPPDTSPPTPPPHPGGGWACSAYCFSSAELELKKKKICILSKGWQSS